MATPAQIVLINELLDELDWDRHDIANNIQEGLEDFEGLDPGLASELIEKLIEEKRNSIDFEEGWEHPWPLS